MEKHLKAAELMATFLDSKFNFFGIRFGMNAVIGLIPVVGDLAVAFLSFYLVWIGFRMGLSRTKISQMIWNIGFNFVLGLIPFFGDILDLFSHANLKNLKILKQYAEDNVIEGKFV